MERIDVLIVDDSAFMRKLIGDFLAENKKIRVVGTARNGKEALTKVKELKPHVVTMDVEMPIMNGLEALKCIMQEHPVPVIMLSSTTKEGTENTLLAIQYGAIDFIAKPSGAISLDLYKIKEELNEKVVGASNANINQLIKGSFVGKKTTNIQTSYSKIDSADKNYSIVSSNEVTKEKGSLNNWSTSLKKLVLIGTSTGGPGALKIVLTNLPKEIRAPILVVQHMPSGFTKSLANRLNSLSDITVKEAEEGDILQNGTAYIAPGGFHLKMKKDNYGRLSIHLDQTETRNGHRPSVDVLFESAANIKEYGKIAVVMTGMGSDGAQGLISLKASGQVKAIAESQATSIVYGMPKSAIATNLTDEIQNVENIANTILKYV
jgi:two-component system, chemotaxis family, protein-glutamate methylesterase/glutaminase